MSDFVSLPREVQHAWAAGFFDGEGCLSMGKNNGKYKYLKLCITQWYDRSSLERFQNIFPQGNICGKGGGDKWQYQANGVENTNPIVKAMWPYLCEKKRDQTALVMGSFKEYQALVQERRLVCKRGHRKTGRCNECQKMNAKNWYERKRNG